MIYLINDPEKASDAQLQGLLNALPAWRRERALRYHRPEDRLRCVLAFCLLEYALRREYGLAAAPAFSFNAYGKPYFAELPIGFNLSHCKGAIACAVGNGAVGIDVERIAACRDRVAQRICSAEEQRLLESAPDKALAFTTLWTQKEAIAKFCGRGLSMELSHIDPRDYLLLCQAEPDYVLTCCYGEVSSTSLPPQLIRVSLEDL